MAKVRTTVSYRVQDGKSVRTRDPGNSPELGDGVSDLRGRMRQIEFSSLTP